MKTRLLVILLAFFQQAGAQALVLLHRNFKTPVVQTDVLTHAQLTANWFPVYAADYNVLIEKVTALIARFPSPEATALHAGHSIISLNQIKKGSYARFNVAVASRADDIGAILELVKQERSSRKSIQQLNRFLDYLKNNRHLIKESQLP